MSSIAYKNKVKYTKEEYNKALKEYEYIIKIIDSYVELLFINNRDEEDISINLFDNNGYLIEQWGSDNYLKELEDIELKKGVCLKDKYINNDIITHESYTSISVPIKDNKDKLLAILDMTITDEEKINQYHKSLLCIKDNLEEQIKNEKKIAYTKNLKNEIKEREKLFIAVMENFNMPVLILNYPNLQINYINKASKNLIDNIVGIDYSINHICGTSLYDAQNINNNSIIKHTIDRIEKKKFQNLNKTEFEFQNGINKTMKFTDIPIYDEKGNIKMVVISGMDITEEYEYLNAKNKFFSFISHELRSPANIIISASQLLLTERYRNELKLNAINHIENIQNNSYRLLRLINNFLDIEKSQAGFLELNLANYDIVYCTEEITDSIIELTNNKGIIVIFDTEFEEKIIALDIDKYEKIILNLLSNATKFTPEGGKIFINLYKKDDNVIISVRDTGSGIDSKDFESIFEKFNNLKDGLPRVESGTGLGLNLVKTLVKKMNGEIKVKSTVGKGTEFLVYLPDKNIENEELRNIKRTQQEIEHITNIEFSDIK